MSPLWGRAAPDVAYVRLVNTGKWLSTTEEEVDVIYATLVWRPEIAVVPNTSWRIHHIGDPVDVNAVPRTAQGEDPRS